MKRLTVVKPVKEMSMTELAHNCVVADKHYRWAFYRDYDGTADLRDFIREYNSQCGGDPLPEEYENLEMVLTENLACGLHDIDGRVAFTYRLMWALADLRERLKIYEDREELIRQRIEDIKSSTNYPHNFMGQMVEDFELVLGMLN